MSSVTRRKICYVLPCDGDKYFLRLIVFHVPGATNFEDLQTINGIAYTTFKETCIQRGFFLR